jgi:hypothetical protein
VDPQIQCTGNELAVSTTLVTFDALDVRLLFRAAGRLSIAVEGGYLQKVSRDVDLRPDRDAVIDLRAEPCRVLQGGPVGGEAPKR